MIELTLIHSRVSTSYWWPCYSFSLYISKNNPGVLSFYFRFFAPYSLYPYWNTKKTHRPLFIVARLLPCLNLKSQLFFLSLTDFLLRSVPFCFHLVWFSNGDLSPWSL